MSPARPPAPPPQLPGFEFLSVLGSGGFADVYLYNQQRPTRQVAVKVLLPHAVGRAEVDDFAAEANVMAQLSAHPFIVTIYEVGASPDGRGYLVMEYCPRPNLQQRYRKERIPVAEAIRIGIQVAGAVETSHRAGILHRDIKPANILTTQFNRPALTDFGIASAVDATNAEESAGLSIPWSPPESFASPARNSAASDVWSLAATVYSMLAGRSPFELPGASNSPLDLMARIEGTTLPLLGRADASASLYTVLANAMAKRASERYPTALAFARALQKVQIELGMSVTPIDVIDDSTESDEPEEEEGGATRIRSITSIAAQMTAAPSTTPPRGPSSPAAWATAAVDPTVRAQPRATAAAPTAQVPGGQAPVAMQRLAAPPVEDTLMRTGPASDAPAPEPHPQPRRRTLPWIVGAAVTIVVIGGGIGVASALHPAKPKATQSAAPQQAVDAAVPAPAKLAGAASADGKSVTFTWQDPAPQTGDSFLWGVAPAGGTPTLSNTTKTTITVPVASGQTCLQVSIRRADGRTSTSPATACVP